VPQLLFIPWFKLEAWELTVPLAGEISLQPFGLLVAVGVLLAEAMAERRARKCGVPEEQVADLVVHVLPPAFVLAYLLNAVFYDPEVLREIAREPSLLLHRYLGLSSYGGFFGGIAGGLVWRRRRRGSLIAAGDPIAYALPAGWFFGRAGCFLVHDHPGVVTSFPLAVENYAQQGAPRHDLGFYEMVWSLAVFGLFAALGKKRRRPGFFLALLPLLYAPVRFFLDFLRATTEAGGDLRYLGLTPGHYGSLSLFALGILLALRVFRGPEPVVEGGPGD
jgi:phosphatidylglycerol:prolipoprotein diacylglycerol transferase